MKYLERNPAKARAEERRSEAASGHDKLAGYAGVKDAEVNNSLPTQGGGAGDRETVARIIAPDKWEEIDGYDAVAKNPLTTTDDAIMHAINLRDDLIWDEEQEGGSLTKADAILSALQAAPSEPDTDNVSLLADLDAGKPCGREAAAVIRQLQADRKAAPSEGGEPVALDRVFIGDVAYVRSDEAVRQIMSLQSELAARPPAPSEEPLVGWPEDDRDWLVDEWVVAEAEGRSGLNAGTIRAAVRAYLDAARNKSSHPFAAAPAPDAIRGGEG